MSLFSEIKLKSYSCNMWRFLKGSIVVDHNKGCVLVEGLEIYLESLVLYPQLVMHSLKQEHSFPVDTKLIVSVYTVQGKPLGSERYY